MMNRLLCIGLLVLGGCSGDGYKRYQVDGALTDFRVPHENLIPGVPWLPPDRPDAPKGFAFQACWSADPAIKPTCSIPFLRGAVVEPLSSFRGSLWQDYGSGAFYRTVVSEPTSTLESVDGGSIVVVSNPKLSQQWYVWRKAIRVPGGAKPQLTDGDEVVATCQNISVSIPYKGGRRETISCDRTFRAKDLAINYQFESQERVPHNLDRLDSAVLAQVDKWRCPK
jgi:hypothetical protein